MSKMKHILRKLHIGGGHINGPPHRMGETTRPVATNSNTSSSSSSNGRIGASESVVADRTAASADVSSINTPHSNSGRDLSFFEEEYEMQLALAISASDPHAREDPESAQIDAAKRISLGCSSVAPAGSSTVVESLSFRYWSYNVVNYDEKVMDGFYDVYGITSNTFVQGKIPLLVDLQAIPIVENVDYEVILVNRLIDSELRELEKRAHIMSLENRAPNGLVLSDLIQRIADFVVDRMGGPVGDADEMSVRWNRRRKELQNARCSIILPLGCLNVGLSRHRALLFKVLADAINLPCLLVKGSYYTGTDDGAVNLIKIDDGSEYIIDLMGAPGTLIPPEIPSSHLTNSGFDQRGFAGFIETPKCPALLLEEIPKIHKISPNVDRIPQAGSLMSEEAIFVGDKTNKGGRNLTGKNQIEGFEHELGKLFASSESSSAVGRPISAQNIRVKDVSKYVISAAKNPEFAQKLHAVLLESGASPPPDLFSDVNLLDQKMLEQVHLADRVNLGNRIRRHSDTFLQQFDFLTGEESVNKFRRDYVHEQFGEGTAQEQRELEKNILEFEPSFPTNKTSEGFVVVDNRGIEKLQKNAAGVDMVPTNAPGMLVRSIHENQAHESPLPSAIDLCQSQPQCPLVSDDNKCSQEKIGNILSMEPGNESAVELIESSDRSQLDACTSYNEKINPMLGEVAEWEIGWEELQIGERIGIGSYGEVYRADWNGTEVAVKKFLDQGFSGDALVQFKSEAEIMLRLRHPNVVLFMGAVTRPPHLSILTEYLPRGSLYRLLHRPNSQVDEKRRMRMALDVAKGMNYLHTSHPTIVHRDLKSPNLLVDKNWVVKVCDFGLSRTKHHTFLSSKSTAGTPEWMAPEVLRNEPANEKCDVYSFGVILWELATCQIPWKGLNPMQVVGAVGFQNRRLEIPESVDPAIAQIIRDCWQMEPHLRPSFSQLISRLRRVQHLLVERANHTDQKTE